MLGKDEEYRLPPDGQEPAKADGQVDDEEGLALTKFYNSFVVQSMRLFMSGAVDAVYYFAVDCKPRVEQATSLMQIVAFIESAFNATLSLIIGLFLNSCPVTIFFAIAFVIINAIQRQLGWTLTHIGEKISEVQPTFTDSYATSSIIRKCRSLWIQAALFHPAPYRIGAGYFAFPRAIMSMFPMAFGHKLTTQAATTFCVTSCEIGAENLNKSSTITLAHPASMFFRLTQNYKALESKTHKIMHYCHIQNNTVSRGCLQCV